MEAMRFLLHKSLIVTAKSMGWIDMQLSSTATTQKGTTRLD